MYVFCMSFTSLPILFCAGEPTSDYEKGRNTDTQQENVQQVQKEQAVRRQLRGLFQKSARQELSLQRRLSGGPHVNGPLAPFQPRWTHAPYTHPDTPIFWPSTSHHQHGDGDGLRRRGKGGGWHRATRTWAGFMKGDEGLTRGQCVQCYRHAACVSSSWLSLANNWRKDLLLLIYRYLSGWRKILSSLFVPTDSPMDCTVVQSVLKTFILTVNIVNVWD